MKNQFLMLLADESGQGLVEYALIVALVAVIAIASLKVLGTKASSSLSNVGGFLK
jgi:pilus assembly protein Flp/PilA